jgi:hypothetical protein
MNLDLYGDLAVNPSLGIAHGAGSYVSELSHDGLVLFLKILLAFEMVYITTVMLIKLAILQMYSHIFSSYGFRTGLAIIAGAVIVWWASLMIVGMFQCNPISKTWTPWMEGYCVNLRSLYFGNAVPNIMTDFAILYMPLSRLWKLQVPTPRKVELCFVFSLGGL